MTGEIAEFIIQALREMNYDVEDLTADTDLGPAGLDLESLALAELTVQIEDTYGLRYSDEDTEALAVLTVGGLAAELAAKLAVASGDKPQ
ncbi:phosphopantetheine-binding protein [Streptacidiphilus sp. EB129]|jgi:acyl carrier protein|uniref:phosphopantetheine-binding protein n=1 Tax=Streptacidiphilus sp. EB129 TaxID=3156262 RepID=UPI003518FD12